MLTEFEFELRKHMRNDFVLTPVLTGAGAYTAGNVVGALMTIDWGAAGIQGPIKEPGLSAILQSLVVFDYDNQKAALDLLLFNAAPAVAYADKTAFAPTRADLKLLIGRVPIAAADYVSYAGGNPQAMAVAQSANQANLGRVLKPNAVGSTALYALLVTTGTPTYLTTSSLQLRMQFSHGL